MSNKRKRRASSVVILILIILLLLVIAAVPAFLYFQRPERRLPGSWIRTVSLGNDAYVQGRSWLDSASLGSQIDMDGLDAMSLQLRLDINEDGSWSESVDEERYLAQDEAARLVLASALKRLIILRATELGALNVTEDDVEEAIITVTGLSTLDYLKEYGPGLLPEFSEISARYSGSGTYELQEGQFIREGMASLRYMVDDKLLVLSADNGASSVYRRYEETAAVSEDAVTTLGFLKPIYAQAAGENHNMLENLSLAVNGERVYTIKALDYGYSYNRYVSMRDFAAALAATDKSFSLKIGSESIDIIRGGSYNKVDGDNEPFEKTVRDFDDNDALYKTGSLKVNTLTVDGSYTPRYYTMIGSSEGGRDAFINVTDIAMLLDLHITFDGTAMSVDTSEPFTVDMEELREEGFFFEVHSALVGNVSTGEIYESWEKDLSVPIASTTKLMTYLCVMDAMSNGEIGYDTTAMASKKVEILSRTGDGMMGLQEGDEATVSDLLKGMLLPSSNDCALMLAECVAGSEEAFVERMNAKARLLGLSDGVIFYNSHGLPVYTENLSTSKIQNHMSAQDMLLLVKHILDTYPQIRDITSLKTAHLASFNRDVKNTNALLYNLPGEVFGLKTGTTAMSGACMVSAMDVTTPDGDVQQLVAVVFGAEDSIVRVTLSQELLLYGKQCVQEGVSSPVVAGMPENAEELVSEALKYL